MKTLQWLGCWWLVLFVANAWAQAPAPADSAGTVNFNYDKVEIRILANTVGISTGKRFVVDEGVTGKVTVVTPEPIRPDEVYPLFLAVLESSGYSVVEMGGVHRIIRLPELAIPVAPVQSADAADAPFGPYTKIIPLRHLSALEMRKALETMVRGANEGGLAAVPSTNHLIITDTAESIARIEQILAQLDRPGASRTMEVITLLHANAEDIAGQLLVAMRESESAAKAYSRQLRQVTEGGGALPSGITVVPSPEANRIIVAGTPLQLAEAKRIIGMLDVEGPSGTGRLHAVFLEYIKAEEAAGNLNALLARTATPEQKQRIGIEPNVSNNAVIIDATPRDFEYVEGLIRELDRKPQQVMVEILIAEVAVGNDLDFGVELSTIEEPIEGSTRVIGRSRPGETDQIMDIVSQGMFPEGLSLGVIEGAPVVINGITIPSIPALITASAQDREIKILSNIPLLAQDNKQASVKVVENIPILSSTIEGIGTARDVIQNIERIDVGIELEFTPHVNPGGEVLMELNPSIEAIVDEGPADQPFAPTIAKREVSTTATVPDGRTVVISGLIRDDLVSSVSKVPLLGDIPLLGLAFRRTVERKQRTNLLIFVTPHIVTDLAVADALRKDLESRAAMTNITSQLASP